MFIYIITWQTRARELDSAQPAGLEWLLFLKGL